MWHVPVTDSAGDVVFFFRSWEAVVRVIFIGTLGYAALFILLRASGKRTLARFTAIDFIITVAIGAAFGRVLTAESASLVEAVVAFFVLIAIHHAVTWAQPRSSAVSRIITGSPAVLFFRGEFFEHEMNRSRVTHSELRTALREHGVGSFADVEAVILESNGQISVIRPGHSGDGSALPTP